MNKETMPDVKIEPWMEPLARDIEHYALGESSCLIWPVIEKKIATAYAAREQSGELRRAAEIVRLARLHFEGNPEGALDEIEHRLKSALAGDSR